MELEHVEVGGLHGDEEFFRENFGQCSIEEHRSLRGGTLATSGFFYNIEHGVAYVVGTLIAAMV